MPAPCAGFFYTEYLDVDIDAARLLCPVDNFVEKQCTTWVRFWCVTRRGVALRLIHDSSENK